MLEGNNMTDHLEYDIYSLIVLHSHQQQLFISLYKESIKKGVGHNWIYYTSI